MKKVSQIVILLTVLVIFSAGQAFAYPIADGSTVFLKDAVDAGSYTGNFDVYSDTDTNVFSTFCVQKDTTFNWNTSYVASIDAQIEGYSSGDLGNPILADGTKYLYWNFSQGTLTDYSGDSGDVTALQNAIWALQGYTIADIGNNEFYSLVTGMGSIDTSGMDVMVMNLWDSYSPETGMSSGPHQSQLIAGAPVPEPSTMVLLGSGLIGLALYRRRMKK